jgi:hypothetical protein
MKHTRINIQHLPVSKISKFFSQSTLFPITTPFLPRNELEYQNSFNSQLLRAGHFGDYETHLLGPKSF